MNRTVKFILIAFLAVIGISIIGGAIKIFDGNYFQNASFISSGIVVLAIISAIYLIAKTIKHVLTLCVLVLSIFSFSGCRYAKSNQQVLVSTDCGMSWKMISAGDAVPKGTMNLCYMRVVLPNFPMQGDASFIANLKDKVRVITHIDYDYSITSPLLFINQAKYLGKANADADEDAALDPSAFEGAENLVIDKRIKDVSKSLFLDEDIVELEQAELEERLLVASNKILEEFGLRLNFITLTFEPDEQTRQAIDVSTAMKIYDSRNLSEIGKQVIIARAAATKIIVNSKGEVNNQPE